ncbi:bile acid:sodium symporter family protein [Rhizosaccharibacter radicis]|uniref:Bile acid:sodium symporter n=1 Tax=Rhizosaccharibacter radicis TaxID=2782605 RepID=A0ABT1VYU9_9PROT|nr:bile acid:sodium symporter [Acetobacteraceae bacterium KSS12]
MLKPDPFLLALVATVALASLLPCRGAAVPVFAWLTIVVIAVMFFMQGARLSRAAVMAGLGHWRLHLVILGCTFVLFPLLGLGLRALAPALLTQGLWLGLLFVCVLPSTVQSSIAFTSIARGNVPAAVCAATASNLLGIVLTPLLVGVVLAGQTGHGPGISARGVLDIVLQLLLPFLLGQLLQPRIGGWAHRNKRLLSLSDRSSILIVVYTAFSAAVTEGLWHKLAPAQFGLMFAVDALLLAAVLLATRFGARWLGFDREDEIAIVFCGSKKTLASGVPMANVLFPAAMVGQVVLPLMVFHQLQLFVCAVMARRYGRRAEAVPLRS